VDAKTRQNLALAYALQGKWMNAKVMAVQDLSPADADARIIEWMGFVRPANAYSQVASLLGVTPAQDGGQPAQLALAGPASAPVATASAAPTTSEPVTLTAYPAGGATALASQDMTVAATAAGKPLTLVAVPAGPSPDPVAAPVQPANVAMIVDTPPAAFHVPAPSPHSAPLTVFAALREIVQPTPAIRAPMKPLKQAVVPTPRPVQTSAAAARFRTVEAGRYVVQLGAFASAGVAQDAWKRNAGRFGLGGFEPANASVRLRNISFVRLSVGGFSERGEATRLCVRIQKAGGSCFVRSLSGDAPAEWVRRGMPNQRLAAR
nr:SPOR domain-containing protein [Sphingomonadaceae bacterium]